MVKLFCAIAGARGSAFAVDIDKSQSVGDLKDAIKATNPNTITGEADRLQLFLAKKDGAWLKSGTDDVNKLKKGEKTAAVDALTHEDSELQGEFALQGALTGMPPPSTGQIHVLVVVPEGAVSSASETPAMSPVAKRQRREVNTSMAEIWELSKLRLTSLPGARQLAVLLERPLPFRLTLSDPRVSRDVIDPNGPLLSCPELEILMNYFLYKCKFYPDPTASKNSWQAYYDTVLSISPSLCRENCFTILECRNRGDGAEITLPGKRPD